MSTSQGSLKEDALGSTLRLKETKQSERAYLDAMGLLSNQATGGKTDEFTVDMRSFNEHTLSGKYHVFRIKNKFPIPGGAVADDFYRRRLIEQNAARARSLREQAGVQTAQQEIAGKAFDKQQQIALPSAIEKLVVEADKTIEEHDQQKKHAVENLQGHIGQPAEVLRVFSLIRARKVTDLEQLFATGEISVNMIEPALYYSGLILSASYGLLTTVRQYLRHGANPNLRTSSGYTALHTAWDAWLKVNPNIPKKVFQKDATFAIVKELLKYKADPNLKTSSGTTALHMACQYGHDQLVIAMLKHGADPSIRDNFGRTAEQVAQEQCGKGNIDRRGCIGILRNWEVICAQQASNEFNSAWRLALESTNEYAAAMAEQSKKGGSQVIPKAGVVDVTARGGADAPLIAAAANTAQALWGKTEKVDTMLHTFSVQQQIFEHRPEKELETVEFDARISSIPTLLDVRTTRAPKPSGGANSSKLPIGVDPQANAVHKKRLKMQWEAANVPQAAAEDAAARQAIHSQATKLAAEQRCARLDKIIPNESQLLEDSLAVANQRETAKLQRLREKMKSKEKRAVVEDDTEMLSAAEKAVLALKTRLASAAFSVLDDAKAPIELQASTGERFVRRPALASALLRPSRFRIDNRRSAHGKGASGQDAMLDSADDVDNASVSGVPPPSLAIDQAARARREAAASTSANATGADKAELDANLRHSQDFLDDTRLLPARGSFSQQVQQKRDDLKEQAISNQFIGKAAPTAYQQRTKKAPTPIRRKLEDDAGNNTHYGNPLELYTASEKPPAHGVLHAAGSINLGSAASLMSLSTLDASKAAHRDVLDEVSRTIGVAQRAAPAQYGIRKALQHQGSVAPTFAESQQLQAWNKQKRRNRYDEVAASKKQWLKSSSLFGRPEEPWTNGCVSAPSDSLPTHSSKRPPKGFKRIRNGQAVYL